MGRLILVILVLILFEFSTKGILWAQINEKDKTHVEEIEFLQKPPKNISNEKNSKWNTFGECFEKMPDKSLLELCAIESFNAIEFKVANDGMRSDNLINEDGINKFLKLKYLNNFAGFPINENFKWNSKNAYDYELHRKIGWLTCRSTTTRKPKNDKNILMAFYTECTMGNVLVDDVMSYSSIGYIQRSNIDILRNDINKTIKEDIASLIEKFAYTFLEIRLKK